MSIGNPFHKRLSDLEKRCADASLDDRKMQTAADTAFVDDETPPDDIFWLLEENARLRALAIQLSNLVGDLPNANCRTSAATAVIGGKAAQTTESLGCQTVNQLSDRS